MAEQISFNPEELTTLFRHRRRATEKIAETRGEYGGEVKAFVEGAHMNTIGFGFVSRLANMSPEKAFDVLRTVDALRDELDAFLGKQNDFFDTPQDEASAPEAEGDALVEHELVEEPADEGHERRLKAVEG